MLSALVPVVKEMLRIVICLIGLSMMCTLLWDMLKEWHLIAERLSPLWLIFPSLMLFLVKELTYSRFIRDNQNLSPTIFITLDKLFTNFLLILAILMLILLPFVWMGAIKATINSAQ